jgi:hypothetical protein
MDSTNFKEENMTMVELCEELRERVKDVEDEELQAGLSFVEERLKAAAR